MIQYDTDGTTLFYIDANGKKFSHYFTEGKPYSDMLVTLDAQQQAIRDNTLAANSYNANERGCWPSRQSAPSLGEAAAKDRERYGRGEFRAIRPAAGRSGDTENYTQSGQHGRHRAHHV